MMGFGDDDGVKEVISQISRVRAHVLITLRVLFGGRRKYPFRD